MHGNRDEHPEVFKARMQFHKDQKKQQGTKDPAKSLDDSTADRANAHEKSQEKSKRPAPFQRKPTPNQNPSAPGGAC